MANILPRNLRPCLSRILQISECRCVPRASVYSPKIACTSVGRYHSVHRRKKFITERNGSQFLFPKFFTDDKKDKEVPQKNDETKLTIFQKFKKMYKEYWYVLIPVHLVTSIGWFGGFYYMARSGVDIISLLEALNVSEKIIDSMKDSHMGYFAIAYACYKIATPVRYTVTLGGTTISINYLKKWGYIKPVPSANKLKELYKEKKHNLDKTIRERKEGLLVKKDELKNKLDHEFGRGIHKIEELKDKTQKMKKKAEHILKEKK